MESELQKTSATNLWEDVVSYLSNFNTEITCEVRARENEKFLIITRRDCQIPEKTMEISFKFDSLLSGHKKENCEDIEIGRIILDDKTKSREEREYLSLRYESASGTLSCTILKGCFHASNSPSPIWITLFAVVTV